MAVTLIRPPDEACDPSIGVPYVPLTRNCASAELLPLFRTHGRAVPSRSVSQPVITTLLAWSTWSTCVLEGSEQLL